MTAEVKAGQDFNEELLSGYLDGTLVQQEEQRARLYLEGSAEARTLFNQMQEMREAAMSTSFVKAPDIQWSEKARGPVSRATRGLGFILMGVWAAGMLGFILWEIARGEGSLFEKLLVFGSFSAFGLLLISVLLDRIKSAKTDPYKGVEK